MKKIAPISPLSQIVKKTQKDKHEHYLDDIHGQAQAKRALTIAAAGRHNILLYGPPGTGKSMLARCLPALLPAMSATECIETTKLLALTHSTAHASSERPLRAPHHTASISAIVGGGPHIAPGEISLAHNGVLFLDEFAEFPRNVLEALRQPLEDHRITINRAGQHFEFPCNFMLVATCNPCPCGYFGSSEKTCSCSVATLQSYQKKLSGPLLDRIDMCINMTRPTESVLLKNTTTSTREHVNAKRQISLALNKQFSRYKNSRTYNANVSSPELTRHVKLTEPARTLLELSSDKAQLSARAFFKIIRVARTIADIENSTEIHECHIAEAIQYRLRIAK